MKRLTLAAIALLAVASVAEACGPSRKRLFHRTTRTENVTTVRYVPVRTTAPVTTSKVVWASPVRSAVAKFALPVARVCGPGGCK